MSSTPAVELVYFAGCPHVEAARAALRGAFSNLALPPAWQEWDQSTPGTPSRLDGFASPTILVAGRDVTGEGARSAGLACNADAVPTPEAIAAALLAATST